MSIFSIISEALKFLFALWSNANDPATAKLKAVAVVTKQMNSDQHAVEVALATNDTQALSAHFQMLADQANKLLNGVA